MKPQSNVEEELEDGTDLAYDLERTRQERLRDAFDANAKPFSWKVRQFDEAFRWMFVGSLGLLGGGYAASFFWPNHRLVGLLVGAGVFYFRVGILKEFVGALRKMPGKIVARISDSLKKPETVEPKTEAPLPDPDTFEGIPIEALATDIAEKCVEGKVTINLLSALGVKRTRGASELQDILLKSEFLLYAIASKDNAYPVGAERVATYGDKNAVTIHSTLMSSPAEDRARVIANAIRRTKKFEVKEDPQIQGEPSTACRMILGVSERTLSNPRP